MTSKHALLSAVFLIASPFVGTAQAPAAIQQSDSKSSEIERLYNQDQSDRDFGPKVTGSPEQWRKITLRDELRRKRVRELLQEGALKAGRDYRQAAFIFQHGSTPSAFLLAHALAMIGVSKGDMESRWIAAATLDRYLQSIGQPQVFGTQFAKKDSSSRWMQDPYDRNLIPDPLRTGFCVPSVAQQQAMLAAMDRDEAPEIPVVCK
jgi:hypothetical protein